MSDRSIVDAILVARRELVRTTGASDIEIICDATTMDGLKAAIPAGRGASAGGVESFAGMTIRQDTTGEVKGWRVVPKKPRDYDFKIGRRHDA